MSPTNKACSLLTVSGMISSPWSAWGTLTYSACPPSMRQPNAQPPSGSVQLFTYPCLQKKHSPQNVSTFTVTRLPGLLFSHFRLYSQPRRPSHGQRLSLVLRVAQNRVLCVCHWCKCCSMSHGQWRHFHLVILVWAFRSWQIFVDDISVC